MAIFHLSASVVSRGHGGSIAQSAAYDFGVRLHDTLKHRSFDHSSRLDVVCSRIMLPKAASERFQDLQTLVDAVDEIEHRCDAQTARKYILALPLELSTEQQVSIVEDFCYQNFVQHGLCACCALHSGIFDDERDHNGILQNPSRKDNPHAHIIVPFRQLGANGFSATKLSSRTHNPREALIELRKSWAHIQNTAFQQLGLDVRVSHESLRAQGIQRAPTPHVGWGALSLEEKGVATSSGDRYLEYKNTQRHLEHDNLSSRENETEPTTHKERLPTPTLSHDKEGLSFELSW